jgi:hypothetical protein
MEDKILTGIISDSIMEIKSLQDHCNEVAQRGSGVTQEDEELEDTPAYKLYWSIYNTEMTRLTLLAVASWYNPQNEK